MSKEPTRCTREDLVQLAVLVNEKFVPPVAQGPIPEVKKGTKIHTTIGVYPNGDFKTNGVAADHLEDHIKYNRTWRPGRALIIDGEIIHLGYFDKEGLEKVIAEKNLSDIKVTKCTVPYH